MSKPSMDYALFFCLFVLGFFSFSFHKWLVYPLQSEGQPCEQPKGSNPSVEMSEEMCGRPVNDLPGSSFASSLVE